MAISTPAELVEEFKKSGEFDRLRNQILKEFLQSDGAKAFLARVEDIAKQKLASDPKLQYMPEATVHREVMGELDRYPIVERAVADVRIFSDPAFVLPIRMQLSKTVRDDREREFGPPRTLPAPRIDNAPWNHVYQRSTVRTAVRPPSPSQSESSMDMDIDDTSD